MKLFFAVWVVLNAGQAQAKPCDLVGEWQIDVTPDEDYPEPCKTYHGSTPEFLVVREGGRLATRAPSGDAPELISTQTSRGECSIKVRFYNNLCPACGGTASEMVWVDATLHKKSGRLSGTALYRGEGNPADDSDDSARCRLPLKVTGRWAPLTLKRVRFDPAGSKERLFEAWKTLVEVEMCPPGPKGRVPVVLHIAKDGGIERVMVGGRDLYAGCWGRTYIFAGAEEFPNPSGAPQTVRFEMKFPPAPSAR